MGHFPGPRLPTEPGNCDVCGWKVRGCGVSLPAAGLEAWLVCDWDFWATPTLDSDTFNPNWQPLDETAPTSEATHYITLSFDWIQFKAAFHCVTSLTLGIHSSQIKIPNQNDRNRGIDYHFFFFLFLVSPPSKNTCSYNSHNASVLTPSNIKVCWQVLGSSDADGKKMMCEAFCGSRGSSVWPTYCIVGNVVTRFWKERRMCGVKKGDTCSSVGLILIISSNAVHVIRAQY